MFVGVWMVLITYRALRDLQTSCHKISAGGVMAVTAATACREGSDENAASSSSSACPTYVCFPDIRQLGCPDGRSFAYVVPRIVPADS